jgi:hypothetical protein
VPCKIIVDRRFRGTFCLHHQGDEYREKLLSTDVSEVRSASIIPDEAARTYETSVDNYFTRQYIPEDNYELHTRRREYLKSYSTNMKPAWWSGLKNSPTVNHTSRESRLNLVPSAWGYS